ncbi:MAG: helix-hairpin-helix domain-containing protein [Candidatus Neomarinimicrobiota bacterium]
MNFFTTEEKRILLLLTTFLFVGLVVRQVRQRSYRADPVHQAARDAALEAFQEGSRRFLATAGMLGAPLDINRAGHDALQSLPGIGPVLARKIVAYRSEIGFFGSVDDLENVSGIGPVLMERWQGLIVVSGDKVGGEGSANE